MISSICHPDLFVFYCRIDTRVVPLSVWGMYNGGTDNQQLFVNDDCVPLKENLHNVSGNTFWHLVIFCYHMAVLCDPFRLSILGSSHDSPQKNCFLMKCFFLVMSVCGALPQILFLSEHFCCLGHMWWMKVSRCLLLCVLCLSSLVSRVPRHLAH